MTHEELIELVEQSAKPAMRELIDRHPEYSIIDANVFAEIFSAGMCAGLDVAIAAI